MKNMMKYLIAAICCLAFNACNDDFLDRQPKNSLTEKTVFTTYDNFKTYCWKFYQNLGKYAYDKNLMEANTDNGFWGAASNENIYAFNKVTTPGSGGDWKFDNIRALNVMLDNIDNSNMTDKDKEHWRSVGYFFKAFNYFQLVSKFGDVPWLEKTVTDQDDELLYGPRTPRTEVSKKILDLLLYAKENIKPAGDGDNTINRDVVNALISRFGLFEGTFQKYHQISGEIPYTDYLQASYDASKELITKYPNVHDHYDELFNSESLAGMTGILLYRNYVNPGKGHGINRILRSSDSYAEACAESVQAFLCSDGKPIWTSDEYEGDRETGDATMNVEFRNRDYRLYYTVAPPYRVNGGAPLYYPADASKITNTEKPEDREYIDFMQTISGKPEADGSSKQLPLMQWGCIYLLEIPHLRGVYNMNQPYNISSGGYYVYKHYCGSNLQLLGSSQSDNSTDCPLFRMGEVMVNHAEAAWELGLFNQNVADITINKLRKRAHVADMNVAEINATFDPKRDMGGDSRYEKDYAVDPVLWEIRRERRVELMFEGFRLNDLRRWRKGKYVNKQQLGVYVNKSDYEDERHCAYINGGREPDISKFALNLYPDNNRDAGRIVFFKEPNPGWQDIYYLDPLPMDQLILNRELKQNPGYNSPSN